MNGDELLGCSETHKRLLMQLSKVAQTDAEVFISGPTGVGKELYARFIHARSARAARPMVPVNCGSLGSELMENELFGHVGGAFTGARPRSEGLVHSAEGGTLFLDEVDSLSMPSQVKLLRFLEEKEYRRLGETQLHKANIRFVAATNVDVMEAVQKGRFREDLYFRLRVVPIRIPPLCERVEDIEALTAAFVRSAARSYQLPEIRLSTAAKKLMLSYRWPGNVRELQNCIRYLTALQLDRLVEPEDLPLLDALGASGPVRDDPARWASLERPFGDAKRDVVSRFERAYVVRALECCGGNVSRAARKSGKNRRAFFELMRKYHLDPADYRDPPTPPAPDWPRPDRSVGRSSGH